MRLSALLLVPALLLPACSTERASGDSEPSDRGSSAAQVQQLDEGVVVLPGRLAAQLAVGASERLFASSPVVVLAPVGDAEAQGRAASVAVSLGAPLLLAPGAPGDSAAPQGPATHEQAVADEVERLGARAVLAVGDRSVSWAQDALADLDVVAAPQDPAALNEVTGAGLRGSEPSEVNGLLVAAAGLARGAAVPLIEVAAEGGPEAATPAAARPLPRFDPAEPLDDVLVLASGRTLEPVAAVVSARAAGADVLLLDGDDPRGDAAAIAALSDGDLPGTVIGVGDGFGDPEALGYAVRTAATGVELPGGGQLVLPGKMYIALYGHPGSRVLGILGEVGGPQAGVERAKQVAAEYEAAGAEATVIPTFEVITTIASAEAGDDGQYSNMSTLDHVRPTIDAAAQNGVYVVLDLQPGLTDFLTQAKAYEELLKLPHVGLALDPEWRLKPGQRHMQQIGGVEADEVNAVGEWLAALVRENDLPQKMLLLHQFKTYMLPERERIVADRPELAVVTQMDGHGAPGTKMETWRVILRDPPRGMTFGWKNFYDEDSPTMTPAQTLAVEPTPVFVSYQ